MCLQYNLGSDGRREKKPSQDASWVKGDSRQGRCSSLCCEFWRSSCPLDGTTALPARWTSLVVSSPDAFNVCLQTVLFPVPLWSCEGILRDAAVDGLSFLHFKCWSPHYKGDGTGSGISGRWLGVEEVLVVEHHDEEKDTKAPAPSFTKWGYEM